MRRWTFGDEAVVSRYFGSTDQWTEDEGIDQLRGAIVRQMYCNCCLGSAVRIMGPPWSKVRLSHLRRKLGPLAACMCAHRRINEQIN
jgi:hypothetical protein